jgi:hypothetical protein
MTTWVAETCWWPLCSKITSISYSAFEYILCNHRSYLTTPYSNSLVRFYDLRKWLSVMAFRLNYSFLGVLAGQLRQMTSASTCPPVHPSAWIAWTPTGRICLEICIEGLWLEFVKLFGEISEHWLLTLTTEFVVTMIAVTRTRQKCFVLQTVPNVFCFSAALLFSICKIYAEPWVTLLKPTGYVMHNNFNFQQLYALPTLYLCVLCLSENKQWFVLLPS